VDEAARIETRNRERSVPPVSAYRWWARRTVAVTGGILQAYKRAGGTSELVVDPFAGGGMVAFAGLAHGFRCYAQDLNPWAAAGLATTLRLPERSRLHSALEALRERCAQTVHDAYATTSSTGDAATLSHTLRVAAVSCPSCANVQRLYPHAMVSLVRRKETGGSSALLACRRGHLFSGGSRTKMECPVCGLQTDPQENYLVGRESRCTECGKVEKLSTVMTVGGLKWVPVIVQRVNGSQRELGLIEEEEVLQAEVGWAPKLSLGEIPDRTECRVLLRHGFSSWEDLYPARQRSVLDAIFAAINDMEESPEVDAALRLALVGTTETAGLASRWDRWYLKNYETMALHRFNLTTLSTEPNVIGAGRFGRGTLVQRIEALSRAGEWLRNRMGSGLVEGPIPSKSRRRKMSPRTQVRVVVGSSERILLPEDSVELILTDPPYHDDIQYSELALPLQAWAKLERADWKEDAAFSPLNGGPEEYRRSLCRLFTEIKRILKMDGRLVFSYANREPDAWVALFGALCTAGLHPLAYQAVHAENETGHWKRNARSCNYDVLLEVTPDPGELIKRFRPRLVGDSDELEFIREIGDGFLEIGDDSKWEKRFRARLDGLPFLSSR
jgi:putative DNA methylase